MSGPETIKAAFDSLLALLASARDDAGHDPIGGRCLGIAITHTENAQLWAEKAYNGEQALAEGSEEVKQGVDVEDAELDAFLDTAEVVEADARDDVV